MQDFMRYDASGAGEPWDHVRAAFVSLREAFEALAVFLAHGERPNSDIDAAGTHIKAARDAIRRSGMVGFD